MSSLHLVPLMVFHKIYFYYNFFVCVCSCVFVFVYVSIYKHIYRNIIYQVCHFSLWLWKLLIPFFLYKLLFSPNLTEGKEKKKKNKTPSELCCQNNLLASWFLRQFWPHKLSVQMCECMKFSWLLLNSFTLFQLLFCYFAQFTIKKQMCKQNTIISSNMRTNESQIQLILSFLSISFYLSFLFFFCFVYVNNSLSMNFSSNFC